MVAEAPRCEWVIIADSARLIPTSVPERNVLKLDIIGVTGIVEVGRGDARPLTPLHVITSWRGARAGRFAFTILIRRIVPESDREASLDAEGVLDERGHTFVVAPLEDSPSRAAAFWGHGEYLFEILHGGQVMVSTTLFVLPRG